MKKILICSAAMIVLSFSSCDVQSQRTIGGLLGQIPTNGNPTVVEIGAGLKQALEIGTSKGADQLSAKDGFLGNLVIMCLFPPEA